MLFNKIDRLTRQKAQLKIKRQQIDDKWRADNSTLEIKLQNIERKSEIIKKNAENKMKEIDRKIEKISKQIKLERDYYNAVANARDED